MYNGTARGTVEKLAREAVWNEHPRKEKKGIGGQFRQANLTG
jgi:hypothetical protein